MESISVPMTCGLSFRIDIADYVAEHEIEFGCGYKLSIIPCRFRWMVLKSHTGYVYNRIDRPKGRRFTVYLHRLLCGPTGESLVNHIDFDTLNNVRANLEIVTPAENAAWRRSRAEYFASLGVGSVAEFRKAVTA